MGRFGIGFPSPTPWHVYRFRSHWFVVSYTKRTGSCIGHGQHVRVVDFFSFYFDAPCLCLDVVGTHRFGKPSELEALVLYHI